VALFTSSRTFLSGEDAPWIDEERRRLDELHIRALEAYAACTLAVGGTELPAAVRAGRELTRREPYRESGWRILMQALVAEGNTAEALQEYERLRQLLRDELGIAPSAPTQDLYKLLLA
jgi:DNA-binding SARP family transcriptional activator